MLDLERDINLTDAEGEGGAGARRDWPPRIFRDPMEFYHWSGEAARTLRLLPAPRSC